MRGGRKKAVLAWEIDLQELFGLQELIALLGWGLRARRPRLGDPVSGGGFARMNMFGCDRGWSTFCRRAFVHRT